MRSPPTRQLEVGRLVDSLMAEAAVFRAAELHQLHAATAAADQPPPPDQASTHSLVAGVLSEFAQT